MLPLLGLAHWALNDGHTSWHHNWRFFLFSELFKLICLLHLLGSRGHSSPLVPRPAYLSACTCPLCHHECSRLSERLDHAHLSNHHQLLLLSHILVNTLLRCGQANLTAHQGGSPSACSCKCKMVSLIRLSQNVHPHLCGGHLFYGDLPLVDLVLHKKNSSLCVLFACYLIAYHWPLTKLCSCCPGIPQHGIHWNLVLEENKGSIGLLASHHQHPRVLFHLNPSVHLLFPWKMIAAPAPSIRAAPVCPVQSLWVLCTSICHFVHCRLSMLMVRGRFLAPFKYFSTLFVIVRLLHPCHQECYCGLYILPSMHADEQHLCYTVMKHPQLLPR